MARFTPFRGAVGDRNDLAVPKGAPVRGSLDDADAFGRFPEKPGKDQGRVSGQRQNQMEKSSPYQMPA